MKKKDKGKDKKSKELLKYFKKGGREGAKEDFLKLILVYSDPFRPS